MNYIQREKAGALICRIISGVFDHFDVDSLLIICRNHDSKEILFFNEVCDFIAHSERKKGVIKNYMDRMYFGVKIEMKEEELFIDEMPKWVVNFMQLQLEIIGDERLPFSRSKAKQVIDKALKIHGAFRDLSKINDFQPLFNALCFVRIVKPLMDQRSFISDFILSLKNEGLYFDEAGFEKQSNKITSCVLYLLHNRDIIFSDKIKGKLYIAEISGKLQISASIPTSKPYVYLHFSVFETCLLVDEWTKNLDSTIQFMQNRITLEQGSNKIVIHETIAP